MDAQNDEWNIRIDAQYYPQARTFLDKNSYKFFMVLEKATNWHWQGVIYCSQNQKNYFSSQIKQDAGQKNGKCFSKQANKYENALEYVSKGLGKFGNPDTPPTEYHTNIDGITLETVVEMHAKWHKEHPKPTIHYGGRSSTKRQRTVFKQLCEEAEDDGYDYHNSELEPLNFATPQLSPLRYRERKSMTAHEVTKRVRRVYTDDTRLAGTNIIQRTAEGLMYKFSTPRQAILFDAALEERLLKMFPIRV